MSHARPRTSPSVAPSVRATSANYSHLHSTLTGADSSSDDEVDPRWTHPKVTAAAAAAAAAGLSPRGRSRREGDTGSSGVQRSNFTRSGYAPTPSPVESTYINTGGVTGTTAHDADAVQRHWSRGMTLEGRGGSTNDAESGGADTFSGIPQPNVDLAGMTEEQRELLEYLQARVGQWKNLSINFRTGELLVALC